jgi:hypothetical protein
MAEHAPGINGQHSVNFRKGFPAVRKHELEHVFASWQRCPVGLNARGLGHVGSHCLFHGALLCRADERGGEFPTSGAWNSSDFDAVSDHRRSYVDDAVYVRLAEIQILFHGGSGHLMHL